MNRKGIVSVIGCQDGSGEFSRFSKLEQGRDPMMILQDEMPLWSFPLLLVRHGPGSGQVSASGQDIDDSSGLGQAMENLEA